MSIFIKGMGNISPQRTWDETALLPEPLNDASDRLACVEPDYASFIDVKLLRRMSRVIRMGIASGNRALKQAGVAMPDGIITGTGYGCLEDTGIFLSKLVENKELALNPTPFIQSTHNTIGSQIALLLQCQAYNQTYAHGAFSFESALLDAVLQLDEAPEKKLLVGGIDEITSYSHAIQRRFGIFRKNVSGSLLHDQHGAGTVNGEGSAFFVFSGIQGPDDFASIRSVATFYKPSVESLRKGVKDFLKAHAAGGIDLVLSGKSGKEDDVLDGLLRTEFSSSAVGTFKNLCGEYPVASAFAAWLGARILRDKNIPSAIADVKKDAVKNVLVFNQYFGTHYSLILLEAC